MASGIVFPDLARSVGAAMQLKQADRRNALTERAFDREEEDRAREREAQQHVPAALAGDKTALGKIATTHAPTAFKLAPLLERMDNNQRTKVKEAADWTTTAAMGVLSLPPEQRPAAYAAALQEGQARGFNLSNMPQQYGPAVESQLNFYVGRARDVNKWFEDNANRPTPMGPTPGGAPPSAAPSPNRDTFVQTMMPHALEVARATGLDPRLVLAQSALETGFGASAPGNNFFGIKSHGAPGGQVLNTREAGPGGLVPTQASFRTYGDAGASARDYADFLKTNSRYAPVLAAQGLDAQIEAMGRSGYATDPNYAAKLRQIAQSLPQPTMGQVPQSIQAMGANSAPMPPPPAGLVPPGPPPANMPEPRFAQGPMVAPGLPQGSDMPAADGSGTPLPPQDPRAPIRGLRLPPGASVMGIKGVPVVKDGTVMIRTQDGQIDFIPLPQRKDPAQQPGPFAGTGTEAQALNMLIANGTLTQQQAAELAAGKTITNPADGSVIFMTPSGLFRQPAGAGQPGAPQGGGNIQVTPSRPMTEGQANAALYADRMKAAETIIAQNEQAGLDPTGKMQEQVPLVGNYLQSESYQKLEQARRDFINAVLRRESGAVISDEEFANAEKQYFPRPGDKPETLKQKAANRRVAIEGISRAAGPTYQKDTPKSASPQGTYIGPDNSPISWSEIETTAKNRNISTDEVIRALGLKPTGMQ